MSSHPSALEELSNTVRTLRSRCAWTGALTHESLRTYLIEESYEVLDAIGAQDSKLLAEELGDLLFQILLHSLIAEEAQKFTFEDVAGILNAKLLRRNQHVFDEQGHIRDHIVQDVDEIIRIWDAAKQAERAGESTRRKNAGLPAGLPALALSQKLLDRHARAESEQLEGHRTNAEIRSRVGDEQQLGQELLLLTARAQELGLDAESVLREQLQRIYTPVMDETSSRSGTTKR